MSRKYKFRNPEAKTAMLKRTVEIEKEPGKVDKILHSLSKDRHLSKTFEGTAKAGRLTGHYTNLALINGMVIGYVKIKGNYERKSGNLKMVVVPGNLYWVVIAFNIFAVSLLTYESISGDKLLLIGSVLFLFMALVITLAFLIESRSFLKHMERIADLSDKNTLQ